MLDQIGSRVSRFLPLRGLRRRSETETHWRGGGPILRELVFGANDGLVSNVSLVAAVAGATNEASTVLLGGIAGLVAGAFSMALGAYVSTRSEHELRETEEQRERWEIEHTPEEERREIRQIFRQKGISGPALDVVVDQVTQNKEHWLQLMMSEELGFPTLAPRPRLAALVMGVAFIVGAAIPVVPYTFIEGAPALGASVGLTAGALFAVGAWRAYLTGRPVWKKAVEMVGLAALAVIFANLIGRLVGVSID